MSINSESLFESHRIVTGDMNKGQVTLREYTTDVGYNFAPFTRAGIACR